MEGWKGYIKRHKKIAYIIGLLFAALGVFGLLRKAGQAVAGQKYIVLE